MSSWRVILRPDSLVIAVDLSSRERGRSCAARVSRGKRASVGGAVLHRTYEGLPVSGRNEQPWTVRVLGITHGNHVGQVGGDFDAILAGGGAVTALAPDGLG